MTSYAPAAGDEQSSRGLSLRTRRAALWSILWVAGAAGTVGALWPVLVTGDASPTVADVIYRLTGGSFVAAGLVAWQRRPADRIGTLMVATGFLFFVAPLAAQVDSSIVQTARPARDGLLDDHVRPPAPRLPAEPRPHGRVWRRLWSLRSQFRWWSHSPSGCSSWRNPDWSTTSASGRTSARPTGSTRASAGCCSPRQSRSSSCPRWRWWRASPPLRRVLLPVLAGGATMLSFGVLLAIDLINGTRSQALLTVTLIVLATVPAAFVVGLLRSRFARVAVGDLVVRLQSDSAPTLLPASIARALHDPSATLAYWLPEYGTYGDLDGRLVSLPDGAGQQATTLIDREGRHVAALVHDRSLLNEPELLAAVTAAAGIAIENAQLHVELRARLEEVRGSRARVIEEGQKERKRLERDLHDGAQQRLVALALNLKLLERRLADPEARAQLDDAQREVDLSLAELRDLARGIHPAVVTGHGLAVALEQVAAGRRCPCACRSTSAAGCRSRSRWPRTTSSRKA